MEGCLEKRLKRKEASLFTGDSAQLLPKVTLKYREKHEEVKGV